MSKCNGIEYRALSVPLKSGGSNKRFNTDFYVEGYATTFVPYLLYEYDGIKFYEEIDRNAFDGADISDVIMLYNHEGKVLARQSNNTLGIEPDSKGLFTFADLSKSVAAKELHSEITEGLITQMSWAFTVAEESYNKETRTRKILKIKKVYDVSAVSIPANGDTEISARSFAQTRFKAESVFRARLLSLKIKLGV